MAEPDTTDNMTMEQRLEPHVRVFTKELTVLLDERQELNKKFASLRDRAKEAGVPHLKLLEARVKLQVTMTPAEQADLARVDAMFASILHMPSGTQADAFGDPRVPDIAQAQLGWEARGRQDGLAGRGGPDILPAGLPEEARQHYGPAWEKGQKETQEAFITIQNRKNAKLVPTVAQTPKRRGKKADVVELFPVIEDANDPAVDEAAAQLRSSSFLDASAPDDTPLAREDDLDEPADSFMDDAERILGPAEN